MARVVGVVQARMGSTRLPGKVLMDLHGKPMLVRVVERLRQSAHVEEVWIATGDGPEDEPIVSICETRGYPVYRGDLHDVLDRFYQFARRARADVVVRVTADCPFLDPRLVDDAVQAFLGLPLPGAVQIRPGARAPLDERFPFDLVMNRLPPPGKRTYPMGLDVEVVSFAALAAAWREAREPHQREHVLPYLYQDLTESICGQSRFQVALLNCFDDFGSLRWTVDTMDDLVFARKVYGELSDDHEFVWLDVLRVVRERPDIAGINLASKQNGLYQAEIGRLERFGGERPSSLNNGSK